MAKKLTKDAILGRKHTDEMIVEVDGEEFTIVIRPLTNREQSRVQSRSQSGITMAGQGGKMQTRAGLDKVTEASYKADVLAVSLGLVDPQFTEDELMDSTFPVDKTAKRIREISGIAVAEGDDDTPTSGLTEFNEGAEFRHDEDGGE